MVPESTPHSVPVSPSLGEAATQFLLSLPSEERPKAQQEVYKFVRWYGEKRLLSGLTIPEVANYTEQIASSTTESAKKLGVIKAFLVYAYKQGVTGINLAVHLKAKKSSSRLSSSSRQPLQEVISLTDQGYADLEAELIALKNERPHVADELKRAAADKDFRENAPLEAAREYQGQLEARIRELESTLKAATVIDKRQITGHKVSISNTILLRDLSSGEQTHYTVVDASEANATEGKISIASPIGRALLGRAEGEEVEVKAPAGVLCYRIERIERL